MSQKQLPSEQFLLLEGMLILSMRGRQPAQFGRMRLVRKGRGGADMKDFAQQHDDTRGSGESCDINQYTEGERHDALNLRINGKFRRAIWTDKEHIECLGFQKTCLISDFVHSNGSQNQDQEHRQGSDYSFQCGGNVPCSQQNNANGDHGSVPYHGLNIDSHCVYKDCGRVGHNTDTCE